mgnify:CR=1 FL=1|jgi:phage baseplate assembly protein W|tara:strand:- start:40940 stop:41320 length:381 start_codon:yes stop_codon:yes gene_type:complete
MAVKTINITFPFETSPIGNFLKLNRTSKEAIKSDITHLLLTKKGERLYNNDFGSGLYTFLFEQIDEKTVTDIKLELTESIAKYIPNVTIDDLIVESDPDNNHIKINLEYSITNTSFDESDTIEIIL